MSREENASFVETICLEAPKYMMKLGEFDVPATKACTLSLFSEFDHPSFFFEQSGRDMLFFSRSWVNMSIYLSSRKISQDDSPYCSMCTCSFLLYSSSSKSSSWSLRAPLETLTYLSFV